MTTWGDRVCNRLDSSFKNCNFVSPLNAWGSMRSSCDDDKSKNTNELNWWKASDLITRIGFEFNNNLLKDGHSERAVDGTDVNRL